MLKTKPSTRNEKKKKRIDKEEKNKEVPLRHPRPLGLTLMAKAYNQNPNPEEKQKIKEEIIRNTIIHYIMNGFRLDRKEMNLTQLTRYLKADGIYIEEQFSKELARQGNLLLDEGEKGQLTRVILKIALKKGLEIQAQAGTQYELLMAQQGGEYVPFLTSSANQALANLINSQKPIHDLIKVLSDKGPNSIWVNINANSGIQNNQYITAKEANEMIQIKAESMMTDRSLIDAKKVEIGALPDVSARNQDLTKIGIKIPAKPTTKEGNDMLRDQAARLPDDVLDEADFKA